MGPRRGVDPTNNEHEQGHAVTTELPPIQLSSRDYRLNWETDAPSGTVFRVYRDGSLIGTTIETFFDVFVENRPGERSVFEIREDDSPPVYNVPVSLSLWWQGSPDASRYRVEKWNGVDWDLLAEVFEEGAPVYKYKTEPLENLTEHTFRIVAIDKSENESPDPFPMTIYTAQRPASPTWDGVWNPGTGELQITIT